MTSNASMYGPSRLDNSLYCCQASVSRISAAARNLKMAASPSVIDVLGSRRGPLSARAALTGSKHVPPNAMLLMKNRRPILFRLRKLNGSSVPGSFTPGSDFVFVFIYSFDVSGLRGANPLLLLIVRASNREKVPKKTNGPRVSTRNANLQSSDRARRRDDTSVNGSRGEFHLHETGLFQVCLHLANRITFSLGRVHEQRGVFRDMQWAGFVRVDVGVVNDDLPTRGQRLK